MATILLAQCLTLCFLEGHHWASANCCLSRKRDVLNPDKEEGRKVYISKSDNRAELCYEHKASETHDFIQLEIMSVPIYIHCRKCGLVKLLFCKETFINAGLLHFT